MKNKIIFLLVIGFILPFLMHQPHISAATSIFDNMPDYKKFREEDEKKQEEKLKKIESIYNHRNPLDDTVIKPSDLENAKGYTPIEGPTGIRTFDNLPSNWQNYIIIFFLLTIFVVILSIIIYVFRKFEAKRKTNI